jgi:hypothetical protein
MAISALIFLLHSPKTYPIIEGTLAIGKPIILLCMSLRWLHESIWIKHGHVECRWFLGLARRASRARVSIGDRYMKNSYKRIRLVREYILLAVASVKLLEEVIRLVNMAFNYSIKDAADCRAAGCISLS